MLEMKTFFCSKWANVKSLAEAGLSEWPIHLLSLEGYFDRHEREMNARRYRALKNLKAGSWDAFMELLTSELDKISDSKWFAARYRVNQLDLKNEFEKVVDLHLKGKSSPFLSSIKGTSLKSISIYEVTSPVFGVSKFEYQRGEKISQGVYALEGGALTFSQTVTGGVFVHFAYPKSKGLLGNKDTGLVYRLFDDISKVTADALDKALRFFFCFNNEMSLYGKPSLRGRVYLWWTKRRNTEGVWGALLLLFSEAVMNALKLQIEQSAGGTNSVG